MNETNIYDKQSNSYGFIKDYKHDNKLRASFNRLAKRIFGIEFEEWYQQGFWNNNYICYSYLWKGEVVSNVSLSTMNIIIDGETRKAVQIGTVMTDTAHRSKGLAMDLLKRVIVDYENKCDLFFLAADEEAIPLYKRCGFKAHHEISCMVELEELFTEDKSDKIEKFVNNKAYLKAAKMCPDLLLKLKASSAPLSKKLSAVGDEHILMFYYLLMLKDSFYSWGEWDSEPEFYVLINIHGDVADWMDVYKDKPLTALEIKKILLDLKDKGIKKVQFNFTPDVLFEGMVTKAETEGGWMILDHKGVSFSQGTWIPRISKT